MKCVLSGTREAGCEQFSWDPREMRRALSSGPKASGEKLKARAPEASGVLKIWGALPRFQRRSLCPLLLRQSRHEVININLRNKPEWYYTKHPSGQIPVLENSKCQLIYESVIACEYLDDAYPGRKLYPYDPYERARQKMLLELFYKVPHLTKACLVAIRCGRECADLKLALRQEFCNLEEVFPVVISSTAFTNRKSSTPSGEMENFIFFHSRSITLKILGYQNTVFFGGDCISMIDYLFWPWFERLDVYGIADCLNHTPALRLWTAAMKQDPTVCALLIDRSIFLGFLNLYFQNNPDAFDYGLTC
ncbi:LOW QUALITY PROTEIN: glutathione S-transferase omega-2-like [Lynx rufus]|uniref:LOW QUALITY PROTEIN: glutathione S-transferase omega-2-like n=1 Tax=Lynx rufus TaxID=61384 RepID=UPI001F1286B7|nr:LOW QUALITY PROTEIN: glutathione S-transferase omega-2-like [Lynx rufus]